MKKQVLACLMAGLMVVLAACGSSGVSSNNASTTTGSAAKGSTTGSAATASAAVYKGGKELVEKPEGQPAPKDAKVGGQFVMAVNSNTLSSDMMPGWSYNGTNIDLEDLMSGYGTTRVARDQQWEWDSVVVKDHKETDNPDGSQTYTVTLNDDLKWSDGSPLTAKDYVFSILLWDSKVMTDLQADTTNGATLVGYDDFRSGKSKVFSGVHLLGDDTFSITVDKSQLPDYYILQTIGYAPEPMAAEAPGVDVKDDGNGCYFNDKFTEDLMRKTLLDPNTGFRYKRPVVCGPYKLKQVDMSTETVELEINPYWKGYSDGTLPHIASIITKPVPTETEMAEFEKGKISTYTAQKIDEENELIGKIKTGELKANFAITPAGTLGVFAFQCDFGPGQFPEVRRAFAYCMDREAMNKQANGGMGIVTDCYATLGNPNYMATKDELLPKLTHYSLDLDKAKQELINGGWTKNATGGDFKEGVDPIRYKEVNGKLMPLIIKWAYSDNPENDIYNTILPPECAKVGMKLEGTKMDFAAMLSKQHRDDGQKTYNVYTEYTTPSEFQDFWYNFTDEPQYWGHGNDNYIKDPELKSITAKMKAVTPGDTKTFQKLYVQFQEAWNKALPAVPTETSNLYTFVDPQFKNFVPRANFGTVSDILEAYVDDAK